MKTRVLVIIGIVAAILAGTTFLVYLQETHLDMELGKSVQDPQSNNNEAISWQKAAGQLPKNEILEKLRHGPQHIRGTSALFLYSEAMLNDKVSETLQDKSFRVDCCQYFSAYDDKIPNDPQSIEFMYISITFFDFEKEKIVIVIYSLGKGEISEIQIQNMIRPGMQASQLEYMQRFPDNTEFLSRLVTSDSKPNTEQDVFECKRWCNQEELDSIGCDKSIIDHLFKYSNLLDDDFDGRYYGGNAELPEGASEEKIEECEDFIYEKRISGSRQ